MGLFGPRGERGAAKGWPRPPMGLVRIGLGGGAASPSFLLFPLSFHLLLVGLGKGGSISYLE